MGLGCMGVGVAGGTYKMSQFPILFDIEFMSNIFCISSHCIL